MLFTGGNLGRDTERSAPRAVGPCPANGAARDDLPPQQAAINLTPPARSGQYSNTGHNASANHPNPPYSNVYRAKPGQTRNTPEPLICPPDTSPLADGSQCLMQSAAVRHWPEWRRLTPLHAVRVGSLAFAHTGRLSADHLKGVKRTARYGVDDCIRNGEDGLQNSGD